MDRFDRIYALHSALRCARHPVSTARLCEELECSPATLRRIVSQLREELRAPVKTSYHEGGGYWYDRNERERYELPGLWFNVAELLALTACLQLLHEIEPGVLGPTLAPLRARWVADEHWHPQQQGRFIEDGRYELRIPYADERELIMDILKQGPDVEVTAPRSLRQAVAAHLQAAAQHYVGD